MNDIIEYNDFVPILLIFETFPRIINDDTPTLSTTEKTKAINMVIIEMSKFHVTKQINDALYQRNGPHTIKMHNIPIDSPMLVWRIYQKK